MKRTLPNIKAFPTLGQLLIDPAKIRGWLLRQSRYDRYNPAKITRLEKRTAASECGGVLVAL